MKLKRLLKKYNKLCKKARKVHEQITVIYEDEYLKGDINACKQILNSLYGTSAIYNSVINYVGEEAIGDFDYKDTDSVIYKDFNKKSEV